MIPLLRPQAGESFCLVDFTPSQPPQERCFPRFCGDSCFNSIVKHKNYITTGIVFFSPSWYFLIKGM